MQTLKLLIRQNLRLKQNYFYTIISQRVKLICFILLIMFENVNLSNLLGGGGSRRVEHDIVLFILKIFQV